MGNEKNRHRYGTIWIVGFYLEDERFKIHRILARRDGGWEIDSTCSGGVDVCGIGAIEPDGEGGFWIAWNSGLFTITLLRVRTLFTPFHVYSSLRPVVLVRIVLEMLTIVFFMVDRGSSDMWCSHIP